MINDYDKDMMRELESSEMEQVSGGFDLSATPSAPDDFAPFFCGEPMNATTACENLGGIYRAYGEDVAIEYAKNNLIPTRDWNEYCKQGGIEYAVQMIWGNSINRILRRSPPTETTNSRYLRFLCDHWCVMMHLK